MRNTVKVLKFTALCTAALAFWPGLGRAVALKDSVKPFFESSCTDCHDADTKKGGLDLTSLSPDLANPETMRIWIRIHDRVRDGEMPPKKKTQPSAGDKSRFLNTLSTELIKADVAQKGTVLRRLNRVEYENTVCDLLGIKVPLQELLPEDGKAHGFDNVGEALDISSIQLQRYMDAANRALDAAIASGPKVEGITKRLSYADGRLGGNIGEHWLKRPDGAVVIFGSGTFPDTTLRDFRAPADGDYSIRVVAYGYQTKEPVSFAMYLGNFGRNATSRLQGYYSVPPDKSTTVEVQAHFLKGETIRLTPHGFPNPYNGIKKDGVAGYKGPGFAVEYVEVKGPLVNDWPGRGHKLLFGDILPKEIEPKNPKDKKRKYYRPKYELSSAQPEADAGRLLRDFIPKAFRHPVSSDKIVPYLLLVRDQLAQGASFEEAMRTGYVAVLCAPDFLFLRERPGRLDDFAVASRLSYFLWNSMPDDQLIDLAVRGELSKPATLQAQTARMLKDPKAGRFTKNFVGQWLNLRDIEFTTPDTQLFPEYDNMLLDAMVKETDLFFDEVLHKNLSIMNFIDSDWTMLNERLAELYNIPGVNGLEFRKVSLKPEEHRGGVLTQASVLKVSANGTTTSPVVRGAWVLERILGTPPPPPPPGIPGVEPDVRGATTLRQKLAKHRTMESCNGCHRIIDPPGFALENYDVIGGWRENYRSLGKEFPAPSKGQTHGQRVRYRIGPKVDATGQTADGKSFDGLADFKKILLADKNEFAHALTEKLLVYATGRGMGFSDRADMDRLVKASAAKNYAFADLVTAVVQSPVFLSK